MPAKISREAHEFGVSLAGIYQSKNHALMMSVGSRMAASENGANSVVIQINPVFRR